VKLDGFRIGCLLDGGAVRLLSRNGLDWTSRFPEIRDAVGELRVKRALLDGEVAIADAQGRTSFQALQNAFGGGSRAGLTYFVFDLLRLDGEDLAVLPLIERKARLANVLRHVSPPIRLCEYFDRDGPRVFAEACRLGLEGLVSKRADAPYEPGRRGGWVKTKCVSRQELVIGGFTDPEGARQGLGALVVGYYDAGRLVFAGKVGTGFTQEGALALRSRLEEIETPTCPFSPPPRGRLGRNVHWVEPRFVAEITFSQWTKDGKVRHPSFEGLRDDKRASDVERELPRAAMQRGSRRTRPGREPANPRRSTTLPAVGRKWQASGRQDYEGGVAKPGKPGVDQSIGPPSPRRKTAGSDHPRTAAVRKPARAVTVAGIRLSHPDRVLYPEIELTKLGLAQYYEQVAEAILPHVQGRPLTLVRCPAGRDAGCFYMKHSKTWSPPAVRRVRIPEKTKTGEYLVVDTLPALVSLVQMNVLEIHTWNSRVDHLEEPDRLVLDVDPGPEVGWEAVIRAARTVRDLLRLVRLESFVKTTGGRGLHVVVPIEPSSGWEACVDFTRALAEAMERAEPEHYTTAFRKTGRERKILIDYLRNNRTNTSIAPFSTRARPRATVSTPLAWQDVRPSLDPASFDVASVPTRLKRLRRDPWDDYWSSRQRLPKDAVAAFERL
jgi:bifunctional non-homologous end joining protein LigD